MTPDICISCGATHDIRLFPNAPIAADEGRTCICAQCYGADPQEPPFNTLPELSGMPAAAHRMGGETSPEERASGAFKEGLTMNITPVENTEYSQWAVKFLSADEKIALARKLCLSVEGAGCADALRVACLEIMNHAERLDACAAQRRSDGSLITPYAPDGGPLRPRLGVVT